jgi:transcriptional regulator GlxA family with amidase domain
VKRQIKLVLVPGFSYLSLGAILEPLKTLKELASEVKLNIDIVSLSEHAVEATSGLSVNCSILLEECLQSINKNSQETVVFICCGLKMPHKLQTDLKKLLRVCNRNKVPIYGVGCAGWKMADAGIIANGCATVHWSTLAAFSERNQNINAIDALFINSNGVTSSPGEAAALDMVIEFIKTEFSSQYADLVCDHLMITFTRRGDLEQPKGTAQRLRDVPKSLREAVFEMSKNLENPLTINKISRVVNLSLRQTERLFSKHLRMTPKKYYLKLRLLHGRQLIEQTSMSILEISIASGFSSRRVFSKYYFNEFGFLPSHTRRTP